MKNGVSDTFISDTVKQVMMAGWRILLLVFMGISAWGIIKIVDVQKEIGDLRTEIAKEYATRAEVQCLSNKVETGFTSIRTSMTQSFDKLGEQIRSLQRDLFLETLKDKRRMEDYSHKLDHGEGGK
jgi:hypothetical protein